MTTATANERASKIIDDLEIELGVTISPSWLRQEFVKRIEDAQAEEAASWRKYAHELQKRISGSR